MSYPKVVKEAALERMFHTDLSLRQIADELSIPRATLHQWKKQYKMDTDETPTVNTMVESWSPEQKFAVVLETATLSEVEFNTYCREKVSTRVRLKPGEKPAFEATNHRTNICVVRGFINNTSAGSIP